MSMSKEEIALQLTLAKLDCLQFTTHVSSSTSSENSKFNQALGEEIANIYNSVYNNLDCYKPSNNDFVADTISF